MLKRRFLFLFVSSCFKHQSLTCVRFGMCRQDHFRAKIRVVLSKLCRKFGFDEIKSLMPEQDRKLVANMQTIAEREIKAKKERFANGDGSKDENSARVVRNRRTADGRDGEAGIAKALRAFDAMMEGKFRVPRSVYTAPRMKCCCRHHLKISTRGRRWVVFFDAVEILQAKPGGREKRALTEI